MSQTGFVRPTLPQIIDTARAEAAARFPEIAQGPRYSVLEVLLQVFAGGLHTLFGYNDYQADQCNLLTCAEHNLDREGYSRGVIRKEADIAEGQALFTGETGAIVPSDLELQSGAGQRYLTTEEKAISGTTATVAIAAVATGEAYNQVPGTPLAAVSPALIPGVTATATVITCAGGADRESDTAYRLRILDRIRQAAHGGSMKDYTDWLREIPGVTRAWAYPAELGDGTVVLRFMMDDIYSDGIPTAPDIATAAAYLAARRPVTAIVSVFAPVPVPVDVTVLDLTPDNPSTRHYAAQSIADMIRREAQPGGTLFLSWFWEAVSQATGCRHHRISMPADDVDAAVGQIAVPGTVTFAVSP